MIPFVLGTVPLVRLPLEDLTKMLRRKSGRPCANSGLVHRSKTHSLFDHIIGASKDCFRDGDSEDFG
jgi:hypothetical protein